MRETLEQYRQSYQEQLVTFIKKNLAEEYASIEEATKSTDIVIVIEGLRKRFLLHTIVVDLYEKEYPFIAEKIYATLPQLKRLTNATEILNGKVLQLLPDGISKIGSNLILKQNNELSLIVPGGELYNIATENIVSFPPIMLEKKDNALQTDIEIVQSISLGIEDELGFSAESLDSKLKEFYTPSQKTPFDVLVGSLITIIGEDDYHTLLNPVIEHARLKEVIGFTNAFELCNKHAQALTSQIPPESQSYNDSFLKEFSAEYSKRTQFLALTARFIQEIPKKDQYLWFLRDQVEPYLLFACRNAAADTPIGDHKLLTISRNSTSLEPKDHYLYVILNDIFYRAANECEQSYEKFIHLFQEYLQKVESTDEHVMTINKKVLAHCAAHQLLAIEKEGSAVSIDTGFQGTFNIYLEALLRNHYPSTDKERRVTHHLAGIWPWLSDILKGQYTTTYFPAILIIEFFDGIHEVVQYSHMDKNDKAVFKPADMRHQLPAFLDLIMIHDVAIVIGKG